ncbi:hypothetical protein GCM10010168_06480 [Actinoplanes ianthinogenes]|uniref:ABC-2 type transport system permease protein n=1 Tax=Actinoplanes ianthinogenes TaxID=122358 RepID=A0ABM7LTI5_9ACTN|nr:DUF6297 family protein [Actinoplanes ianthinogenes]BCJ42610.1 hypothetical protein Aiant_32670 [Actinoplanes ianthinogenes]GGQ93466.1 hypothetical protein GCM10010168_06480 [Actinoplanes ianthinogenes]
MTVLVPLRPVRRWIHQRQASHRERGATLGNLYVAVLFVAVVGAMLHRQLATIFWPPVPDLGALPALALALLGAGFLLLALRAIGPVTLGRPAAYFLLTAPVSRRRLLLPSLRLAAAGAAVVAALVTTAIAGHAAPHDLAPAIIGGGALLGIGLLLVAVVAQRSRGWATVLDRLATAAVAGGLALLVADTIGGVDSPPLRGWPSRSALLTVTATLAVVVAAGSALVVRKLALTPADRVLDAAKLTGTLFDSAFGVEPSFLTDMVERRYWAGRRLRSARPPARLPVLTGQDFLMARRRLPRLLWLLAATPIPLLLAGGPAWVPAVAVPLGAMVAAGTTTGTVNTDAGNPVLARLLGLGSRRALVQRLWIPGALAFLWSLAALLLLEVAGKLPPGPWWLLSLPLGVAGGVAAVRRARSGFVRNDLLPLDTPMGTVSTGPLVYAFAGPDALILAVPTVVGLIVGDPLSLTLIVFQFALALIGTRGYLVATTDPDRVELSSR